MSLGTKLIVIGVVLLIGAAAGLVQTITSTITDVVDSPDMPQFLVPGRVQLPVDEPGRYYLWHDYRTVFDNQSFNVPEDLPHGVKIEIRDAKTGQFINLQSKASASQSDMNTDRSSIGSIVIERPGEVVIDVAGDFEPRVLSFGRFEFFALFGRLFGGIALSMLAGLASIVLLIVGIIKVTSEPKAEPENDLPWGEHDQ